MSFCYRKMMTPVDCEMPILMRETHFLELGKRQPNPEICVHLRFERRTETIEKDGTVTENKHKKTSLW